MGDHSVPLTKNQQLVYDSLSDSQQPLSAYALLDRLKDDGIRAPLQVYRCLEKLQQLGLVHRLESLNAFVACQHPEEHNHDVVGFAICDICEQVIEFSDTATLNSLAKWVEGQKFSLQKTMIELHGRCASCQSS